MADHPPDPAAEGWHLDRRIPAALIVAIGMQTVAGVWWAASINGRVDNHEARIGLIEQRQDETRLAIPRIEERQKEILRRLGAED